MKDNVLRSRPIFLPIRSFPYILNKFVLTSSMLKYLAKNSSLKGHSHENNF
jgi:hypothetical protein